jgi:hypothetical protein
VRGFLRRCTKTIYELNLNFIAGSLLSRAPEKEGGKLEINTNLMAGFQTHMMRVHLAHSAATRSDS